MAAGLTSPGSVVDLQRLDRMLSSKVSPMHLRPGYSPVSMCFNMGEALTLSTIYSIAPWSERAVDKHQVSAVLLGNCQLPKPMLHTPGGYYLPNSENRVLLFLCWAPLCLLGWLHRGHVNVGPGFTKLSIRNSQYLSWKISRIAYLDIATSA
jgi:hypothetical protein